jgi:periplasmic protein TonB
VLIEAVVDREGGVTVRRVLKTLPLGLENKAREAVERWQFKPATLHGRPVEVSYTLVAPFSLPHPPRAEGGGGSR